MNDLKMSSSVMGRLRGVYERLTPAQKKIAGYLLQDNDDEAFFSISDLALRAGVSEATIVRFCKEIGFAGFPEFKKAFLQERLSEYPASLTSPYREINLKDSPSEVLDKVFTLMQESLNTSKEEINPRAFDEATDWIKDSNIVELYAHGGSGFIALNTMITYQRLGIRCTALTDPQLQISAVEMTTPDDVIVAISHTGTTPSVVQAVIRGRERGIKTCAITSFPGSPLALHADLTLLTSLSSPILTSDAGVLRIAQVALLDAIGVVVAQKRRKINML